MFPEKPEFYIFIGIPMLVYIGFAIRAGIAWHRSSPKSKHFNK